jgi:hypothetical protein
MAQEVPSSDEVLPHSDSMLPIQSTQKLIADRLVSLFSNADVRRGHSVAGNQAIAENILFHVPGAITEDGSMCRKATIWLPFTARLSSTAQ